MEPLAVKMCTLAVMNQLSRTKLKSKRDMMALIDQM